MQGTNFANQKVLSLNVYLYCSDQEYIGFAVHSDFTIKFSPIFIDFNFLIRFDL